MQRAYEAYLKDILESIRKIEKYTEKLLNFNLNTENPLLLNSIIVRLDIKVLFKF